ncbi:MAG: diacylglycerol kinase [Puniceicoccales bacterium]|jgi:undecaprenol kinase|nr:diacylglycerol kinase [Puniceicoccales bacterium]
MIRRLCQTFHKFFNRYIFHPFKHTLSGFKFAFRDRSFQLEIILGLVFYPLFIAKFRLSWRILLLSVAYISVLMMEMINCAIEKVVDLASPRINFFAKQAKDMASAAVSLALCNLAMILLYCFFA